MEPNKLEKDFKKKLEQRTIQPSDMAWDRLDAMLSVTEKKQSKPNRTWMYIAASFLVFLLVGVLFINQEKENNGSGTIKNDNGVVTTEQPTKINKLPQDAQTITAPLTEETVAVQTPSVAATANQRVVSKNGDRKTNGIIKTNNGTTVVPIVNHEAVATTTKKEGATILPAVEAENLVAMASTQQETAKKKPGVKVDPNSLLSSVEGELNDSYRNKTLQGVVKGFNTVKVAVANRNYE